VVSTILFYDAKNHFIWLKNFHETFGGNAKRLIDAAKILRYEILQAL